MEREHLKSRLGFILLSAGCAIGIGNVWKFPYMAGQHGGGAFVLIYLFFLLAMGVPVLSMEFAIGRASQKSPVKMYQQLEKKGSKWHVHGYFAMIGNYILMMFYTCVAGWMLQYFIKTASGQFEGLSSTGVTSIFNEMLNEPASMILYMGIIIVAGMTICSFDLQGGLEKITKVMMLSLLIIMILLAGNSFFMPGSKEGLEFYLVPNFKAMKEIGIFNVIVGAMNQAFFTLSLGMGSMAIFGSYIGKERSLLGESINVALLDTFVAICSGLIIFPACFTYNVEVGQGPSLIFDTLPNVFNNIPMGRLWGSLFFLFLTFAALSTVLAVFENINACIIDITGWSRKKTSIFNTILIFALSLPCALGYNILKFIEPLKAGNTILDLEDFIVSNIFLPLGSLVFIFFCTTRYGWKWDNYVAEANQGKGLKVAKWMRGYCTYVLPLIVFSIFAIGIYQYFAN